MTRLLRLLICLALLAPVPAPAQELSQRVGPDGAARELRLRSTTNLSIIRPVLDRFLADRPGTAVIYEQWLSNNLFRVVAAECEEGGVAADLVISSAVHQMVDLVNRGCAARHVSARTLALPSSLNWRDELWGVSQEPSVMVYNRTLVAPGDVPRSRFDLLDRLRESGGRFDGRVATYDIEASGLGYLFAYADSLEATTFGGLMEAFGRTGAVATCCSAEIIGGVLSGTYLIGYNIIGSYAFEVAEEDPRLGIVAPSDYTLMLSRGAMIPRGAAGRDLAAGLVDFLLSETGREALGAAHLYVTLGDLIASGAAVPGTGLSTLRPVALSPSLLVASDRHKRALFLDRWRASFPLRPETNAAP